jgi:UDP-N-acetylmuramate dehydrogenase
VEAGQRDREGDDGGGASRSRTPRWGRVTTATTGRNEELERRLGSNRLERGVSLAPFTTFKIGGPADLLYRARTGEELASAILMARELEVPHFLLGTGANILIGDGGFRGLVIRNEVAGIEFLDETLVRAGSGVEVFRELIEATVRAGLGGLHHFVGIPSTVGGAIWQNLHFLSPPPDRERTVFIEEVVESCELLTEEGERRTVDHEYLRFGYDYSILHERQDVVLSCTFRLVPTPEPEMREIIRENLKWRDERHPDLWLYPSAGSIFQKIEGIGAGRLIDQCGLKGQVHGNAQIFHKHANIIVNLGGASARDVLALIELAQSTVRRELGYELRPEIGLIGEF